MYRSNVIFLKRSPYGTFIAMFLHSQIIDFYSENVLLDMVMMGNYKNKSLIAKNLILLWYFNDCALLLW